MLNVLKDYDKIETRYSEKVKPRGSKAGEKKYAEFCRKIDDLVDFAYVLRHSDRKITEDHKKIILMMYQAILKQMKQEVRGNEIFTFRSALREIEQDVNDILNPLPGDDMNKFLGRSAAKNPEKTNDSILMYSDNTVHNDQVYQNLQKFKYALEISNRAIYGKPSPQYTTMQTVLNELTDIAGKLGFRYNKFSAEDWNIYIAGYNNTLSKLKEAAENYYQYKMNATHGGTKANKRERSRMKLASLILHTINGENLAKVCGNIPDELKIPSAVRENETKKQTATALLPV